MTPIAKYLTEAGAMAYCARYPRKNLIVWWVSDGWFHVYDMEAR